MMASDRRHNDEPLDDHGRGARRTTTTRGAAAGETGGLWSDAGDGTIGDAGERLR
jgi:hypothetical protein